MNKKKKPSLIGLELTDWTSFKTLDRVNKKLWGDRWKLRTGNNNLRGWNDSQEYRSYVRSKERRLEIWEEKNPENFAENVFKRKAEGRPAIDPATGFRPVNEMEYYESIEGYSSVSQVIADIDYVYTMISRPRKLPLDVLLSIKDDTGELGGDVTVRGTDEVIGYLVDLRTAWILLMEESSKDDDYIGWLITIDGDYRVIQTKRRVLQFFNITITKTVVEPKTKKRKR